MSTHPHEGQTLLRCGICSKEFWTYEGMRQPGMVGQQFWCKPCQDEFDSIDWDAVYEERRENGSE